MLSFLFILGLLLFVLGVALIHHFNDELGMMFFIVGSVLLGTTTPALDESTVIVQLVMRIVGVFNG